MVRLSGWFSGLSPRRRLVLGVPAVVLVVVLAAALVAGARGGGQSKAALHGTRPAQDQPGPVVLVPGYGGGSGSFDVLAARLRAAGRAVSIVQLPGEGTGDLAEQARTLDQTVRAALAAEPTAASVDLVGYSAGGVVIRLWMQREGGAARSRRVVTLGSPQHGTSVAGIAVQLAPADCPTACQQLAPNSTLLRQLNRGDETPDGPAWLSLWTTRDQAVTPPDSARLGGGAVNVPLQSLCPDSQVDHGGLPRDPLVIGLVLATLGPGPVQPPAATDCAALRTLGASSP